MNILKNISDRDKRLLVPLFIAVAFLSLLLFVDYPLYKKGKELEKKAVEEEKRLNSIISMGQEYVSIKNEIDDITERAFRGEGAALSGIDAIVGRIGLRKKLSSLKPATSPVAGDMKRVKSELVFEKITLNELSRLAEGIESEGRPIAMERVSIKSTYADPSLFNVTMVVNAVERD